MTVSGAVGSLVGAVVYDSRLTFLGFLGDVIWGWKLVEIEVRVLFHHCVDEEGLLMTTMDGQAP